MSNLTKHISLSILQECIISWLDCFEKAIGQIIISSDDLIKETI